MIDQFKEEINQPSPICKQKNLKQLLKIEQ